jgi:hypothetical protein
MKSSLGSHTSLFSGYSPFGAIFTMTGGIEVMKRFLTIFTSILTGICLFTGCSTTLAESGSTPSPTLAATPTKLVEFDVGNDCDKILHYDELSHILNTPVTQTEPVGPSNVSGTGLIGACNYETPQRMRVAVVAVSAGSDTAALNAMQQLFPPPDVITPVDGFGEGAFTVIEPGDQGNVYYLVFSHRQAIFDIFIQGAPAITDDPTGIDLVKEITTIVISRV